MTAVQDALSPDFIAQTNGLDIKARLVVEGFLTGLHKSPYHGFSGEFAEYRSYYAGRRNKTDRLEGSGQKRSLLREGI